MPTLFLVYADILKTVKTKNHRERLVDDIDTLLNSLFSTGNEAFQNAVKNVSYETGEVIKEAFLKDVSSWNQEMIKDFLTQLKEQALRMPTIRLSLAFVPTDKTIDNISDWIAKNIGRSYVLDITQDQTILGGIVIDFEGRYKDFSLRKTLKEVFLTKREEITRMLNS